jgi:uncharacterized protein (DUF2141 family)
MTGIHLLAFAFSLLPLVTVVAPGAELTITVKDVRNTAGSVFIALYNSDSSYLKLKLATAEMKGKAAKGDVRFVVRDLPAGTYAVTAFHDENDNGKLDKNWLGIPTEGYGFSNDVRGAAGPPKFLQAAFDLAKNADKSISFSLNY